MTHEGKRLIELLDERIERMQERSDFYRDSNQFTAKSNADGWVDATSRARDDVLNAIQLIEWEAQKRVGEPEPVA